MFSRATTHPSRSMNSAASRGLPSASLTSSRSMLYAAQHFSVAASKQLGYVVRADQRRELGAGHDDLPVTVEDHHGAVDPAEQRLKQWIGVGLRDHALQLFPFGATVQDRQEAPFLRTFATRGGRRHDAARYCGSAVRKGQAERLAGGAWEPSARMADGVEAAVGGAEWTVVR